MASSVITFFCESKIEKTEEVVHKYLMVDLPVSSKSENVRVVTFTHMTKESPHLEPIVLTNVSAEESIEKAVLYLIGLPFLSEYRFSVQQIDPQNP